MFKLRNIYKIVNILVIKNYFYNLQKIQPVYFKKSLFNSYYRLSKHNLLKYNHSRIQSCLYVPGKKVLALSILGWLGFVDTDEEKESELIMTLKRAVLSTQREEYNKAEQLLHLALRLAQQQQNQQGIMYCYDLMANLALTQLQLEKSEKLFVSLMQMLLSNGVEQNDLKVIHISLKLARICHLKAEEEKAEIGYKWCLEKIENIKNNNMDSQMLYGVIQDWYAQYLLDKGDVQTSLKHLKEAYNVCCNLNGQKDGQNMLLLNDLGITCWRAGDLQNAEEFIKEAINIGKTIEDQSHLGVCIANLGLLYLEKGFSDIALKHCKEAWKLGTRVNNPETIEQANYCFEQIKIK